MGKSCPGDPGNPPPRVTLGAPTIHTFPYKSKRAFTWQITTCLGEEGDPGPRDNFFPYKLGLTEKPSVSRVLTLGINRMGWEVLEFFFWIWNISFFARSLSASTDLPLVVFLVFHQAEDPSLHSKLDIPYDPDCFMCKVLGVTTLYGAGYLVLSNVKKVPASNRAGKFMMGLFGVGEDLKLMTPVHTQKCQIFTIYPYKLLTICLTYLPTHPFYPPPHPPPHTHTPFVVPGCFLEVSFLAV